MPSAIPRLIAAWACVCAWPALAQSGTSWKFQFGAESAEPGRRTLLPGDAYPSARGFGFEPGSAVTAVPGGGIAADQPFFLSVQVPAGNYRVTVTLGNPQAAAVTTVKAEVRRLMLERIATAPGQTIRKSFTVNVRDPKLSDGREVDLDSRERDPASGKILSRDWDDKLTLEFSGTHPSVQAMEIERTDRAATLFITGDSTVTDQPGWPGSSWGQMIPRWFGPEVAVANHAESGETLKGFLKERRWAKVLDSARPGDVVIIEFGTNDSKAHGPQNIYPGQDFSETYAPAGTTYKELLRQFVRDVRARGAQPVIVSPSARRGETAEPTSLAPWARAAMEVAREMGVPGIDLNLMGTEINRALGPDAAKQFADRTHHVEYGSYLQAKCIVLGLEQAGLPIARFVRPDFGHFDPRHPEPLPADFHLPPDPSLRRGPGRRPPSP